MSRKEVPMLKNVILVLILALLLPSAIFAQTPKTDSKSKVAAPCKLEITGNDMMKYDKSELKIKASACKTVSLTLKHVGKMGIQVMGHNWVLANTKDMMAIVNKSMEAGQNKDANLTYIPKDAPTKALIITHTKMLGGGESTTITFPVSQLKIGGDYTYFCTFPGHFSLMKGKFVVEK